MNDGQKILTISTAEKKLDLHVVDGKPIKQYILSNNVVITAPINTVRNNNMLLIVFIPFLLLISTAKVIAYNPSADMDNAGGARRLPINITKTPIHRL